MVPGTSRDRRQVAVVVMADGRRVQMPVAGAGLVEATLLSLIRSLIVGIEDILVLVIGSQRETGGTRRDGRR